jgi:hypothetical protein
MAVMGQPHAFLGILKRVYGGVKVVNLRLQISNIRIHHLKLTSSRIRYRRFCRNAHILGVLEAAIAAIGCVQALQGQVSTSLTWRLAIAFYLPPFALITGLH